jgi:D-beta-D-heptose 7-phosphate kinase/D-beta-D-heptose 1-phosphate adenosyltransferase
VAANVVGLGAKVELVGLVGEDADADELRRVLSDANIGTESLVVSQNRRTTVKTRIVAHHQQVARVDVEDIEPVGDHELETVQAVINHAILNSDVVILSDYGKGFLSDEILQLTIDECNRHGRPVLVDPKGKDYAKYRGATLLTPNQKEAAEASRIETGNDDWVAQAGRELIELVGSEAILITQGERGMALIFRSGERRRFPALARNVYDVTGAGDTVIATLAAGIAAGADFALAAAIANIAAGIVVEQLGTTAISHDALSKEIRQNSSLVAN